MSTATAAVSARRKHCYGCCVSQERGCVVLGYAMAAVPAKESKCVCSSYGSSSILSACTLPALGSVRRMINDTQMLIELVKYHFLVCLQSCFPKGN